MEFFPDTPRQAAGLVFYRHGGGVQHHHILARHVRRGSRHALAKSRSPATGARRECAVFGRLCPGGFRAAPGQSPALLSGYGVIGGAGIGLGYVTPVATVAKWFPDRKGLATGIVVMGLWDRSGCPEHGLAPLLVVETQGDLPRVFIWLGVVFAMVLIPCSWALRGSAGGIHGTFPWQQDVK